MRVLWPSGGRGRGGERERVSERERERRKEWLPGKDTWREAGRGGEERVNM